MTDQLPVAPDRPDVPWHVELGPPEWAIIYTTTVGNYMLRFHSIERAEEMRQEMLGWGYAEDEVTIVSADVALVFQRIDTNKRGG